MTWINVEDELPPDYEEVLYFATFNNGRSTEIMCGHREHKAWFHCCLFYSSMQLNPDVIVTHWMPLPDYPKECND